MLTVACVYWQGKFRGRENIYDVTWVRKLRDMVQRNLDIPYEFVCLSNVEVPYCDRWIPLKDDLPGYWSKVELFRPGLFHDRVLYLDLDVLVLKSLKPLVNYNSEFAIMEASPKVRLLEREGKTRVHRYNSSVMAFDAGVADSLYIEFDRAKRQKFFGDQDWIGHKMPQLHVFPGEWVKKLKNCPDFKPNGQVIVVLCMAGDDLPEKNKSVTQKYKWAREIWN